MNRPFSIISVAIMLFFQISPVFATMQSANFRIYGDSIGGSGGLNTSANFRLQETSGEPDAGSGSSASFNLLAGFQSLSEHPTFTFTISSNTLSLGELSETSVSSDSVTLTTSTNAAFGYITQIIEDGDLRDGANTINDVADGTVTAGDEEYGIAVTGPDATFADDRSISTTGRVIAQRTNWKNGAQTNVTFKASKGPATPEGSYSHVVTFISTGTF